MEFDSCLHAPSEWRRVSIDSVCTRFTSGGTPSRKKPEYFEDGVIPWVKTKELLDRVLDDTEEWITEEAILNSSAKRLPPRTLLMAMYGATVGQLGILGRDMACNQACAAMVVDDAQCDYRFLYYQLLANRRQIVSMATGAAQQNLSGAQIKGWIFPLPDKNEHRRVAEVLWSLDERIFLLRQTNATLEAIAQALFKSWFVDFDPVRAKAEGREPEGMDASTAALFPSSLEDSEIGPIPAGWRVETFDSAFEFTMGQSPPGFTYNTDGAGTAFFQGCTDFGDVFPTRRVFTTAPSRFARAGDVLMSVRAPIGALNLAVSDCAIGRGLCAIRHKSGSTGLTIEAVKASVQRIEAAAGEGALFKSLSKRQLADLPVASAGGALVTAAVELLDPIVERRLLLARQAEALTQLRDTLLPRLISGRIRLSAIHSDGTSGVHNPTANREDVDVKA